MSPQAEDHQAELIAEQMRHAIALLRAEIGALRREQEHDRRFSEHRLGKLEQAVNDHEERLRQVTDGVSQFKVWSGLASGSSGLMSLAALLKSFLGLGP